MTGAQLQTRLAYRLGENAAPSDSNTKTQRYWWLTEGLYNIARRRNWWWLEATNTTNTNTGSTTGYAEPTDLKEFIEFYISNIYYDQVPYTDRRIYTGTSAIVSIPVTIRAYKYYRYNGRYYLIPADGADAAVHNIHYYKRPTAITADTDTLIFPEEYSEALLAYAEAKYWLSITQQAKAVVPFQQFEEVVSQMNTEQESRGGKMSIMDPEGAY